MTMSNLVSTDELIEQFNKTIWRVTDMKRLNRHICTTERCKNEVEKPGDTCETCKLARQIKGIAVEIADTGVGLSPKENELIFEPFFTARDTSKGTGLGLWICQLLVSRMGGRIEVESTPGKGSTFRMLLEAC